MRRQMEPAGSCPFSGKFTDLEPAFTMDGKKLFFVSNRPITGTALKILTSGMLRKKTTNGESPKIWASRLIATSNEYYPSVSANGNLYFTAARKNSTGGEDIYVSVFANGKYSKPIPLDTAVNSVADEFNAFVSPDEQFIIFSSYGRKDDKGGGDLYMSKKNAAGRWMPSKNLSISQFR